MMLKDPFIKTELKDHLSRTNLIKEMCVDKKEHIFIFCPKCLKLTIFNKIFHRDHLTGEEPIIYECDECKRHFLDKAWNPHNSIETLIKINDLIAPYQTIIQIIEFNTDW